MKTRTHKLTYWVAPCLGDSDFYSIRRKTRKEVVAAVAADWKPSQYGPVVKATVEYTDALDLLGHVRSEAFYEG